MSHENSSSSGKRSVHSSPLHSEIDPGNRGTASQAESQAVEKRPKPKGGQFRLRGQFWSLRATRVTLQKSDRVSGVDTSRLQQKPAASGEELVAMQLNERHGSSSPGTFLLLDLRRRPYGGDRLLNSIARKLDTNNIAPVVILVTSLEQFYRWGSIDRKHCWQYHGHPSSVDLTTALQSLLLLWTELAKFPKEKPALEKAVFVDYYCSHRN